MKGDKVSYGNSVLSTQLFCKLRTALKEIKPINFLKNVSGQYRWRQRSGRYALCSLEFYSLVEITDLLACGGKG